MQYWVVVDAVAAWKTGVAWRPQDTISIIDTTRPVIVMDFIDADEEISYRLWRVRRTVLQVRPAPPPCTTTRPLVSRSGLTLPLLRCQRCIDRGLRI